MNEYSIFDAAPNRSYDIASPVTVAIEMAAKHIERDPCERHVLTQQGAELPMVKRRWPDGAIAKAPRVMPIPTRDQARAIAIAERVVLDAVVRFAQFYEAPKSEREEL